MVLEDEEIIEEGWETVGDGQKRTESSCEIVAKQYEMEAKLCKMPCKGGMLYNRGKTEQNLSNATEWSEMLQNRQNATGKGTGTG